MTGQTILLGNVLEIVLMHRLKLFFAWYKKLRKNYFIYTSFVSAVYNSKYFNIDGSNK